MRKWRIPFWLVSLWAAGCGARSLCDSTAKRPPTGDRSVPLAERPTAIAAAGGGVYVASFPDAVLRALDAASGRSLARFDAFDTYAAKLQPPEGDASPGELTNPCPCRPGEVVWSEGKLFVPQVFSGSSLVFDTTGPFDAGRLHLSRKLRIGGEGRFAPSPDGRHVYFASGRERAFYIIDTATWTHERVPYPEGGFGIGCAAASPDGRRLYLGIQRGGVPPTRPEGLRKDGPGGGPPAPHKAGWTGAFLAAYDLTERRYGARVFLSMVDEHGSVDAALPADMAFADGGRMLYVAMGQCQTGVYAIDTASCRITDRVTFASRHPSFPWPGCTGLAVHGDYLVVVVGCNYELAILERATHRVVETVGLGGWGGNLPGPLAVADGKAWVCHRDLRRLFVVDLVSRLGRPPPRGVTPRGASPRAP